jgi:hypothetical protein
MARDLPAVAMTNLSMSALDYCAVNHVHRALPELAPGGRLGVGWAHIVATGRASHDNGCRGGVTFINDILDYG